jgi:DNA-binding LacI/PurR family transcriptional regulator
VSRRPPKRGRAQHVAADTAAKAASAPAARGGQRLQMADIARLANVSVATVSRALNDSPLINEATRARIRQLARSLNYAINQSAKNLRLRSNRTVAVVIPYDTRSRQHISDPFFLSMVGSLADALTDRDYDMLLSRVDAESLDSAAQLHDSGVAIGIVLIGQWRHHDQLNELAARRVPIVVWGGQLAQQLYCTVGGDNVLGGRLATEHLLELGRRRIVFLGDPQLPEVALRLEGYRQALEQRGRTYDEELVLPVPFAVDAARAAVDALCRRDGRFDGVVASSDLLALSAIQAIRANRRQVPADVSVVGYDDIELAAYCDPPLSTISQPVRRAGVELVESLQKIMQGGAVKPRVLPVKLIVRASSTR